MNTADEQVTSRMTYNQKYVASAVVTPKNITTRKKTPVVTRLKIILFVVLGGALATLASQASAAESSGKYSKLSNKELRTRALTLVKGVRELVYSYHKKDRDLTAELDADYLATRTTERQSLRDQWRKKVDDAQASSLRNYQQNFAVDATLVRQELQKRLPKNLQRDLPKLYSNPANVLALEVVADDLELLAKSLPET